MIGIGVVLLYGYIFVTIIVPHYDEHYDLSLPIIFSYSLCLAAIMYFACFNHV